ncbi:MAG: class I SAM-dependent methyltransferase, partial [Pseudomonadota bacterium]
MTTTSALAFVRGEDEGETTGDIYQQPDPRGYFRVMFGLDYVLPDIATSVFRQLITARRTALGRRIKIVDIGCGYATNAALIRFPLDMDDLAHRYRDLDHSELSAERLIELDQHFFKAWPSSIDADFVGFDIHAPALDYAKCVGLVADVVCCDLAQGVLSDADRSVLGGADLIISTTAADFLDEDRFGLLLDAVGGDPWCAVFGLRVSPMFELEAAAKARGLVSERLEGTTFVQRRF